MPLSGWVALRTALKGNTLGITHFRGTTRAYTPRISPLPDVPCLMIYEFPLYDAKWPSPLDRSLHHDVVAFTKYEDGDFHSFAIDRPNDLRISQ